jgi:uncharacterized protein
MCEVPELDKPVGLFPLPNVVLFPHTTLPLQVFEKRYRTMVREAIAGDGLIAMALLLQGYEPYYYTNIAKVHPVVGVGRISEHVQVADGRYFINVLGVCRGRIQDEDSEGAYRKALLEPVFTAESSVEADGEYALRQSLESLLRSPTFAIVEGSERAMKLLKSSLGLGELTDLLAATLLPMEVVEVKQCMLEEGDPLRRAGMLLSELQTLHSVLAAQQRTQDTWPRLGSNN